jgi:hypothetical protein
VCGVFIIIQVCIGGAHFFLFRKVSRGVLLHTYVGFVAPGAYLKMGISSLSKAFFLRYYSYLLSRHVSRAATPNAFQTK